MSNSFTLFFNNLEEAQRKFLVVFACAAQAVCVKQTNNGL